MTLTICIGSSCHLKGSKQVAQTFERLINEHGLKEQINFYATFCMGNCQTASAPAWTVWCTLSLPRPPKHFSRKKSSAASASEGNLWKAFSA